jgi:hypothetical protein
MDKVTKKKFIGQPIFTQILSLVNRQVFNKLVKDNKSDRYFKQFDTWTHFVTLMYGILSRCDSVREIVDGLIGCVGKLVHFGLKKAPAKSTICDGNQKRDNKFFENLYYSLVKRYSSFLSDSQIKGLSFKQLFVIDSTTIKLFSDLLFKGVGRNPKDNGKKKGGLKVHMLIDAVESVAKFVRITAAKVHDRQFLKQIVIQPLSMVVFDKAYNDYKLFAQWTLSKIWFVTRMKTNAVYKVVKTYYNKTVKEGTCGVLKEEWVQLFYKQNKEEKVLLVRRIEYQDEKNRKFVFISNNFEITVEEIALIYKLRWQIELLFKKMKQNFQLHYFYGESENAIRIQLWCTLIAQLLLTVIQKKVKAKKAFSTIACTIRLHLISYLNLEELLKNASRYYKKMQRQIDYSGSLFPEFAKQRT